MERIELVKEISEIDISSLVQIGVDEDIKYIKNDEGINVVGILDISGVYQKCDNTNCSLNERIDVDMNILYENIQNSDKFRLYVDDFDYEIMNNNLILRVYVKFDSYRDVETTFPAVSMVEEVESIPNVCLDRVDKIEEDSIVIKNKAREEKSVPFLESFFKKNTYSKSASLYSLKEGEDLEDVSNKFNIKLDRIKNLNRDKEYQKGDLISLPLDD